MAEMLGSPEQLISYTVIHFVFTVPNFHGLRNFNLFSELNVHCRGKCTLKKSVNYLLSVMISSCYSSHCENREQKTVH